MQTKRILIVDNDDKFRTALIDQLSMFEEYETLVATSSKDCLNITNSEFVDVSLICVDLPDIGGIELVKQLRKKGFNSPIILLVSESVESNTILGLDSGANDCVEKPCKFLILNARIRAHLRQHEQSENASFTVAQYVLHPMAKMLVDSDNVKIRLTDKEVNILKYLFRAGLKPVKRDEILDNVWGYNSGSSSHTLETHIYRLRQKIEKDPKNSQIIVYSDGGYMLVP